MTLAETIDREKETLLRRFRNEEEQIETYVFEVSIMVNETLRNSSEKKLDSVLDELCSKLESSEKLNLSGVSAEIQRYVAAIRKLIRKQILNGEVVLSPIPVFNQNNPMDSNETIILAKS
jgi:ribosomal protein S12